MFPSRSITNTILIGNPVIALTTLTQHAARLHSLFVSNPDFPYIASSILLSINTQILGLLQFQFEYRIRYFSSVLPLHSPPQPSYKYSVTDRLPSDSSYNPRLAFLSFGKHDYATQHLGLTARPTPDSQTPHRDQIGEEPVLTHSNSTCMRVIIIVIRRVSVVVARQVGSTGRCCCLLLCRDQCVVEMEENVSSVSLDVQQWWSRELLTSSCHWPVVIAIIVTVVIVPSRVVVTLMTLLCCQLQGSSSNIGTVLATRVVVVATPLVCVMSHVSSDRTVPQAGIVGVSRCRQTSLMFHQLFVGIIVVRHASVYCKQTADARWASLSSMCPYTRQVDVIFNVPQAGHTQTLLTSPLFRWNADLGMIVGWLQAAVVVVTHGKFQCFDQGRI